MRSRHEAKHKQIVDFVMTNNDSNINKTGGYLDYLPVGLFGSVMGLTGLAIAWRAAHAGFDAPLWAGQVVGWLALLAFIILTVAYTVKLTTSFASAKAEFLHPIAGNLFGTPLISMLLLPIVLAEINLALARGIWVIGAVAMTAFAWLIVSRWITVRQKPSHATPAWIVPVVGMIDVPLALPALGWADSLHGVMVFATAVGLFFAIPLFTIIIARLMFEEPFPEPMQPALLILVAPFAVGFSAYVTTSGSIDLFAEALYMLMLFMLAVLLVRLRSLANCCPFRVSWWAISFPLAASAVAALRYAAHAPSVVTKTIAIVLLAIATFIIAALLIRTMFGIARGELRTLSN
jgi:tellurite resistance protein